MLVSLLPFVLIFVIMYFLILRPQQKRAKQHQEMVKNMRRGDGVVTSGGLVGKITKVALAIDCSRENQSMCNSGQSCPQLPGKMQTVSIYQLPQSIREIYFLA